MRPPEFTGGNAAAVLRCMPASIWASMRPPEFTGGNLPVEMQRNRELSRFNEAAGIHRRKPTVTVRLEALVTLASMRPPEFTGGNY